MAAERPCSRSDILTCEDLQRELQDFAKEKLPELFETFAKETAKISCEQLKEVLDSMKITRQLGDSWGRFLITMDLRRAIKNQFF